MSQVEPIARPLTEVEARNLMDDEGRIKVVIAVSLNKLCKAGGVEGLNQMADDRVLEVGVLSDISYRVVGHVEGTDADEGKVLIEVTAEVEGIVDLE